MVKVTIGGQQIDPTHTQSAKDEQKTQPALTIPESKPHTPNGNDIDLKLKGLHVLVVDDDPDCRSFICLCLKNNGMTVYEAGTAEDGVAALADHNFDAVLTDKNLPGMDGLWVIKQVRQSKKDIPVIMITGQATVDSAIEAFKNGADDYMTKPITEESILTKTLQTALKHHRLYKENQILHQKLLQAKKMESIGILAAGIAHEINNPCGFILSNIELMQLMIEGLHESSSALKSLAEKTVAGSESVDKLQEQLSNMSGKNDPLAVLEEFKEMVNDCHEGTMRITNIVAGMRGFARPETNKVENIDINTEIEKSLALVRNEIKYKCTVTKELQTPLPLIEGNAGQINQVLVNLFVNAAQSMDEQPGELKISSFSDEKKLCISVKDSGKGITQEDLEHIFDPFFTTKDVGKGMGLGLSIVYGIIENHGGTMKVDSKQGTGTTVKIEFPLIGAGNE